MTTTLTDGIIQSTTLTNERAGFRGQLFDADKQHVVLDSAINAAPQAAEVATATFSSVETSYPFTFHGVSYTWTPSSTPADTTAAAAAFATWWNEEAPALRAYTGQVTSALAVATITAAQPGVTLVFGGSPTGLAFATTTSADDADAVTFGDALVMTGYQANDNATLDPSGTIALATTAVLARLTSAARTFTVTSWTAGRIGVNIESPHFDTPISLSVPFDTDIDTSLDNLATAVNQALADYDLDAYLDTEGPSGATASAGEFYMAAQIAGFEFQATMFADQAATIVLQSTTLATDSFLRSFFGVALSTYNVRTGSATIGTTTTSYPGNSLMSVVQTGRVVVATTAAPAYTDQVYIDLDDGSFAKASGSNRLPLPRTVASWGRAFTGSDGNQLAVLNINCEWATR